MPQKITEYQLFFAHPSDIKDEYDLVSTLIVDWNVQHGAKFNARIQMTSWQTHSYPASGDRPQAIINKQIVDDADIVVGVFWSKFGTPTGEASSGTEEEIRRSITNGKKVMLYFSDRPLSPSRIDITQYSKIQEFKKEFKETGVYWSFNNTEEFEKYFRQHLAAMMHELIGSDTHIEKETSNPENEEGIPVSVELNSRYWIAILGLIESQLADLPRQLEMIRAEGKQPDDLHEGERLAIVGPLIARATIIDSLVEVGIMTQDAKQELGLESLINKIKKYENI